MESARASAARQDVAGRIAGPFIESNRPRSVFAPWWMPPLTAIVAGVLAYVTADDTLVRTLIPLAAALFGWLVGVAWLRLRARTVWRLSGAGLQRLRAGKATVTYPFSREHPLLLSAMALEVRAPTDYGSTKVGNLCAMGLEDMTIAMFPFWVTTRRLGAPLRLFDGPGEPEGNAAAREAGFSRREAALLAAVAEGPLPAKAAGPVELSRPEPEVRTRKLVRRLGCCVVGLVGLGVVIVPSDDSIEGRVALIASLAMAVLVWAGGSFYRVLRTPPAHWTVSPQGVTVRDPWFGSTELPASAIAGIVPTELTRETGDGKLSVSLILQFYGHDLALIGTAYSGDVPPDELIAVLRSRGYRVIQDQQHSNAYDVDPGFLPHQLLPEARFTLGVDHVGWEGEHGAIRIPRAEIGGLELHTRSGHPWLRLRGTQGAELLHAPLGALRIARSELRDQARALGYPVSDPERDAYESAAFAGLSAPSPASAPPAYTQAPPPQAGPPTTAAPASAAAVTVGMPGATRKWYYITGVLAGVIVMGILAFKLRHLFDNGLSWTAWGVPAGAVAGALGALVYDRRRPALVLDGRGIRMAADGGQGKAEWEHARPSIGGVGIDDHDDSVETLLVWSPTGQVIRKESLNVPDPEELRVACERSGLPWGRPDLGAWGPPPEL
ncbi:hypothetical protein ACGFSB_05175 [Streptomyces sp. NPDC048441]|uniref:hypothetical protein n=1 Tax=Streptomyces sp. NPDC048441 TaxID=3365552 RepID=UPI00371B3EF2